MKHSANTSDTEQQTKPDSQSAGHAQHVTMLGICIADILRLGGTWPPVGTTPTTVTAMHYPSAPDVICTTKEGNGVSVNDLTSMSPAALKKLCEQHNASERMKWKNSGKCWTVTVPVYNEKFIERLPSLTDRQKQKMIHELRNKRRRMLHADDNNATMRKKIGQQLYMLTGHRAYIYGDDT